MGKYIYVVYFLLVTVVSASGDKRDSMPLVAADLHDGDLVMRNGRGLISAFFKSFSQKDKRYSHSGLVRFINGKPYVFHYLDEGFKRESFSDFTAYTRCTSYSVFRYRFNDGQKEKLIAVMDAEEAAGRSFDTSFDLATDDMYCTEWIYKCLQRLDFPLTVSTAGTSFYVAADDLYVNADVEQITSYEYEK